MIRFIISIVLILNFSSLAVERPNILVLISDDQNMDSIGAYGARFKTPHIDRLASEGIMHTRAYTTSSLCVPTRYSCLTGSYPSRSRNRYFKGYNYQPAIRNGAFFCKHDRTIVEALQESGYYTGISGKWHNDYHDLLPLHEIHQDADPNDPSIKEMLEDSVRIQRKLIKSYGFDYAEHIVAGNVEDQYPKALEHHNVEYVVKGALDFLNQAPKNQPFFLWTAFTTVHGPREPIQSGDITVTPEGYTDKAIGVMKERSEIVKKHKNITEQTVVWMDEGIGVILNELEKQGRLDNTLIVFLSDQQNTGKSTPYESGNNIPFIVRWPDGGLKAGLVNHTLVDVTDLAATIMDVANAKPVEGLMLDGLSILPVWSGKTNELKRSIYTEIGYAKGVVTKDWKYIAIRYNDEVLDRGFNPNITGKVGENIAAGNLDLLWKKTPFGQIKADVGCVDQDQLYDLRMDPNEETNVIGDPKNAEVVKIMRQYLAEVVQDIGRPFGEFVD